MLFCASLNLRNAIGVIAVFATAGCDTIDREEAIAMIHEIRSFPILSGLRGKRAADINAIADSIQRLSQLVMDFPEILEADINPLLVGTEGRGAVALDVRFIIKGDE